MTEWFENEKFWEDTYETIFPEKKFEEADDEIDKVLKLTNHQGGPVLDLCCGPGRHVVALAKRNIRTTGVDRTRFLLNKARERANQASVNVEFAQSDMRDFLRESSFELILSMFSSFGYFENKDDDFRVLQNIRRSLLPGGKCVIDVASKEVLARIFKEVIHAELANGSQMFETHEIFDDWTRIKNRRTLVEKSGRAQTYEFCLTVYSAFELKELMLRAGFQSVKAYGSFDATPYDNKALRLVVVGVGK
ncbi:MAG: class I SAM-dependent methyltransferase [Bdellovibrionota bacterium]